VQGGAGFGLVIIVPAGIVPASAVLNLLGGQPEQEEVLLSGFLSHLDSGAVARADGQSAVHHELHVACATGFVPGGRNLFGQVRRGDQSFGKADIVVGQEEDLEPPADGGVVVDGAGDIVDQLDDKLGQVIGRGGLAGKEHRAVWNVQVRIVPEAIVEHHHVQH